uniref:RNA polymerase alpha subunit n=1 Tax=Pelargonium endlicherianum TaxID=158596 RepID=A0A1L4BMS9_9ROSI|nr:RNA polymerase alpha subunit [Pelargonium endlicherianum]YP_009339005.1 RNA polymerase alpha subunit [Pelargonium endlicherianum]API84931.1 RNA polymerase alpha subunit [Pelargonium endlicherianum]API84962.1 RNA polymerase alpha subunit [Pelargonium endlicherianum]
MRDDKKDKKLRFKMPNDKYFGFEMSNPNHFAEWQYVEYAQLENGLRCGRFGLAPLTNEQCQLIKNAVRQTLLTEILCARFTRAKMKNASNHLMNIVGIEESIPEILHNLSQIKLRGNLEDLAGHGPLVALLDLQGPQTAMAVDIELPPGIEVVDESHHIATITKPIPFFVELQIEIDSGESNRETPVPDEEGYSIDAIFRPIHKVDSSIYSYEYEGESFQSLFLEIWSEPPSEPYEALLQALKKIFHLLSIISQPEYVDSKELDNGIHYGRFCLAPLTTAQFKWIQTAFRQALLTQISGEWNRETLVHKVDSTIDSYEYEGETETLQTLVLDIWTDSKINPQEAIFQASAKIMELFSILLQTDAAKKKYFERKRAQAQEREKKHQPGPPGWEEGLSRGWVDHWEIARESIISRNKDLLLLVYVVETHYRTYKSIRESILQELRSSIQKLKNIRNLTTGYTEQKILVKSIVEEIKASLEKLEKACMVYDYCLNCHISYISFKEGEIAAFEQLLRTLATDSVKKMKREALDKLVAELQDKAAERQEREDEISREENERMRIRREQRDERKQNRKKEKGEDG